MSWLRIAVCGLASLFAAGALLAEEAAVAPSAAPQGVENRKSIGTTGVSLDVPPGFSVSADFAGIGRAEDLSSVMVTVMSVPVSIAAEAFSEPALRQRGVELGSSAPIEVDGRQATFIEATQHIGGMTFRKWFLVFGNETRSVLLTATTPIEHEAQHRDALVHALHSVHWPAGSPPAGARALPFQVKEVAPLRIVRSADDSIVLSDPGAVKGHVPPLVAVGASQAQVDVQDLAAFAKARLEETVSIHEIAIEAQGPQALGSLPGHQIRATARDTESGRAVRVQQILASDGSRYYLVQGIFDAEDAVRLAPAFEALAASFSVRDKPAPGGGTAVTHEAPAGP